MQNLDQIRAAKADQLCKPREGQTKPAFYRSDVASIPALILTNGLLCAAAYCCEEGKDARKGMKEVFNGITAHLLERGIATVAVGRDLPGDRSWRNSLALQRATAEALSLLTYLKRYSVPKSKE